MPLLTLPHWAFQAVWLALPLGIALNGAWLLTHNPTRRGWHPTTGRVVERMVVEKPVRKMASVIEYRLPDGQLHRYASTGMGTPKRLGDEVSLLFDPADPRTAEVAGAYQQRLFSGWFFIVMGLAMGAFGAFLFTLTAGD